MGAKRIDQLTGDFPEWAGGYAEPALVSRKICNEAKERSDFDNDDEDEGRGHRGKKVKSRMRDIEDKLELRRLSREVFDDYADD
ncbi:MAG: hypothetical protein ACPGF7_14610 [Pontibacterium sp.]